MTCSAPPDCAEIERRHATGIGLLVDGGASRGNLLSGEADDVILTVSRMDAEKKSNPGYRAFLANGDNVTRTLVLFLWEIVLEWTAALRGIRRDVRPRGHRGGIYPLMRAAMCVFVRDLIVSGVLTDMMRGRPAVYATFSSYDEVAHHSGLERADTLEALRKLDDHFAQIERARRYAPRPYEIVVLSDHGQTQGATFKQRNGYGLDELVERSLAQGDVSGIAGGDEQSSMVGHAVGEATGKQAKRPKNDVSDRDVVVLGSGNLGLVYLMEERRRLTLEEIEERHPQLVPALRAASARRLAARPLVRARGGRARRPRRPLPRGRPHRGRGPARAVLAHRAPAPPAHRRLRARRRHHGRQLLRPRARRGLRLRGADLLPRRPRRPADAPVHPPPVAPRRPAGPDPRRRERARHPRRLAEGAPGRRHGARSAGARGAAGPGRRATCRAQGSHDFMPSGEARRRARTYRRRDPASNEGSTMAASTSETPVLDLLARMTAESIAVSSLDAADAHARSHRRARRRRCPAGLVPAEPRSGGRRRRRRRSGPRRARRDRADRRHRASRVRDRRDRRRARRRDRSRELDAQPRASSSQARAAGVPAYRELVSLGVGRSAVAPRRARCEALRLAPGRPRPSARRYFCGDRGQQRDEHAEAGEDVDDREDLRPGGGRGEVSVADRRERDDAEVERLDDGPVLEAPEERASP